MLPTLFSRRRTLAATILCFSVVLLTATASLAQGAKAKAKTPDPGDIIEVNDFGEWKVARFLEMTGNGRLLKVTMPDGRERPFLAKDARPVKNKVAAEKKFAEASGGSEAAGGAPVSSGAGGPGKKKRTWSDKSGKFKIEASFVELKDGKLRLKKDDGKEVVVQLDKLSEADQEIANLLAEVSPATAEDNPFQPVEGDSPAKVSGTSEITGDPSTARKVTLDAPDSWSLSPDNPTSPTPPVPGKVITLPKRESKNAFFEGATGVAFNPGKSQVWVTIKQGGPGGKDEKRVEVVDATNSAPLAVFVPAKAFTISGFSPSGSTMLAINDDDFFKKNERVELWKLDGKQVRQTMSLRPYKGKDGWGIKVTNAFLLSDERMVTLNDQGWLVVWEVPAGKPLWSVELAKIFPTFTVSPTGKQIAVYNEKAIYFLDSESGKTLGKLTPPAPPAGHVRLAFRPEGQLFAMLSGMQLVVWELQSGKAIVDEQNLLLQAGAGHTSLDFGSDGESVVIDNSLVVDLSRRMVIAKYQGGGAPKVEAGELWSVHSEFKDRQKTHKVVHVPVPSKEVLSKASSANEEALLAIKPGTKVALQLALPFDGPTTERIRQAILEKIKANGWQPADSGAEALIKAEVSQGKPYETEYRGFGLGGSQKVTITPLAGKIELIHAGKSIWQTGTGWGPPHFLTLKEGETIQQATQVKASPEFFTGTAVPKRIFAYPKNGALVTANITADGVKLE